MLDFVILTGFGVLVVQGKAAMDESGDDSDEGLSAAGKAAKSGKPLPKGLRLVNKSDGRPISDNDDDAADKDSGKGKGKGKAGVKGKGKADNSDDDEEDEEDEDEIDDKPLSKDEPAAKLEFLFETYRRSARHDVSSLSRLCWVSLALPPYSQKLAL